MVAKNGVLVPGIIDHGSLFFAGCVDRLTTKIIRIRQLGDSSESGAKRAAGSSGGLSMELTDIFITQKSYYGAGGYPRTVFQPTDIALNIYLEPEED